MASPPVGAPSANLAKAIALAGFLAGTLDALAAIANYLIAGGKTPIKVFHYIASAVLGGDAAYSGGWLTAACGLLFHFLVAYAFTVFFFLIYPRLKALAKYPVTAGLGYGVFVWLVMSRAIVPLTRAAQFPFSLKGAATAVVILMVCVGLPISLVARRHYAKA